MISAHEHADLLHIMKINRLTLIEADTAHLTFNDQTTGGDYEVRVLIMEDTPSVVIRKSGALIYSETVKSVDDLKIFLEERLYQYLKVQ